MKITYRNRADETITREVEVGAKLVGMRLDSVTFDGWLEVKKLCSEDGLMWLRKHVLLAMRNKQ
jgi:hypothetical protein